MDFYLTKTKPTYQSLPNLFCYEHFDKRIFTFLHAKIYVVSFTHHYYYLTYIAIKLTITFIYIYLKLFASIVLTRYTTCLLLSYGTIMFKLYSSTPNNHVKDLKLFITANKIDILYKSIFN